MPKIIVMISSRPILSPEDLPPRFEDSVDVEMVVCVVDMDEELGPFEGDGANKHKSMDVLIFVFCTFLVGSLLQEL